LHDDDGQTATDFYCSEQKEKEGRKDGKGVKVDNSKKNGISFSGKRMKTKCENICKYLTKVKGEKGL
jgi:hypothetical protein